MTSTPTTRHLTAEETLIRPSRMILVESFIYASASVYHAIANTGTGIFPSARVLVVIVTCLGLMTVLLYSYRGRHCYTNGCPKERRVNASRVPSPFRCTCSVTSVCQGGCAVDSLMTGAVLVPMYLAVISSYLDKYLGDNDHEWVMYFEVLALGAASSGLAFVCSMLVVILSSGRWLWINDLMVLKIQLVLALPIFVLLVGYVNYVSLLHTMPVAAVWTAGIALTLQTVFSVVILRAYGSVSYSVVEKDDELKEQSTNKLLLPVTIGEWVALSFMFTMILSDYFVRYFVKSLDESATRLLSEYGGVCIDFSHVIVSQAGLVGCVAGIVLATSFIPAMNIFCRIAAVVGMALISIELSLYSLLVSNEICLPSNIFFNQPKTPHFLFWICLFLTGVDDSADFTILRQRFTWIVYWAILLVTFSFLYTVFLSFDYFNFQKLPSVIVSRKLFHFVAIALFVPVTRYSPALMSLAYAVAFCLLLTIECVRIRRNYASCQHSNISSSPVNAAIHYLCAQIDRFYAIFLDDKDIRGGNFVITHLSLLLGCAIPCWTCELLASLAYHSKFRQDFAYPSLIGVIVIGVGDSFGAIVGKYWGKTKWPDSKRSIEGSLSMFVSMSCCLCFGNFIENHVIFTLVAVTLLEASTSQIDNFVLPLAAVTFLLMDPG